MGSPFVEKDETDLDISFYRQRLRHLATKGEPFADVWVSYPVFAKQSRF
jgi:hypothetical protein